MLGEEARGGTAVGVKGSCSSSCSVLLPLRDARAGYLQALYLGPGCTGSDASPVDAIQVDVSVVDAHSAGVMAVRMDMWLVWHVAWRGVWLDSSRGPSQPPAPYPPANQPPSTTSS